MTKSGLLLEGKVAVVTGSKRGIGKAIALSLAKAGADVAVCTRVPKDAADDLESVAKEIRRLGRRSLAVQADVSRKADVDSFIKSVMDEFGVIDILVNNAGGAPRERGSLFCESTEEVWDYVLGKNLKGVFLCTRAVINHMIKRRSGKIISLASSSGMGGDVGLVDYSAAKAGVIGFTMALAKEVAQYGINVNCVSPGPTENFYILGDPKRRAEAIQKTGVGRLGKPEEIAALVVFLASDQASFITGQNYPIGGLTNLGH